jgi:hypothetical protein
MHTTTYSLRPIQPPASFTDTAREVIRDIQSMSAQAKARLELLAVVVGLILAVAGALKGFVFMPPRLDAHDIAIKEVQAELKAVKEKASATDIAIAGIVPQLTAINQGIGEIKADVRDLRNAK